MDLIPEFFWIGLLVWTFAKVSLFIRFIFTYEEREKYSRDQTGRFLNFVSEVALWMTAVFAAIIIGVSLRNLAGG